MDRVFWMVHGVVTDLDPTDTVYDSSTIAINDNDQMAIVTHLARKLVHIGRLGSKFVP